jgi:DNA-directed RNA polymerase specialized sigma24 family protein
MKTNFSNESQESAEKTPSEDPGLIPTLADEVSTLREPLFKVFSLRASGLSYEEIALRLEIPTGTVKSRLHEAVRKLREKVKTWNVN